MKPQALCATDRLVVRIGDGFLNHLGDARSICLVHFGAGADAEQIAIAEINKGIGVLHEDVDFPALISSCHGFAPVSVVERPPTTS